MQTTRKSDAHLLVVPVALTNILLLHRQHMQHLLHRRNLLLLLPISETRATQRTSSSLQRIELLLDPLDVLETKLVLDDLHVADGVDVALDVDDLGVVERADDLEDAVDGADVGEEGVSEAGTCRGALGDERGEHARCMMVGRGGRRTAVRPAISMTVKAAGTRDAGL